MYICPSMANIHSSQYILLVCPGYNKFRSRKPIQVTALAYSGQHSRLLSTGEDSRLVCWNMEMPRLIWKQMCFRLSIKYALSLFHGDLQYKIAIRLETPDWAESDNCQLCNK